MFPNLTSTKTCLCQLTLALTINIDRHSSLFLSLGPSFLPSFPLELWRSRLPLDSYISPQLLFICHHHHHIRRNRFMLPATHNCTWDRCNKSVCETTTTTSPHHHKREINSLLVSIQNPITYVPRGRLLPTHTIMQATRMCVGHISGGRDTCTSYKISSRAKTVIPNHLR